MYITSLILFIMAVILYIFDYFVFHYLKQDMHFKKPFMKKPEKPFLAFLVGLLATNLLSGSIIILLLAVFTR